ncbi:MAG: hypothetical protein ACE5KH_05275, partial [Candidatus Geothermarchaeales archaeon]
ASPCLSPHLSPDRPNEGTAQGGDTHTKLNGKDIVVHILPVYSSDYLMKLPQCSEPAEIRNIAYSEWVKHRWDADSLTLWIGGPVTLPSYLWTRCNWKEFLGEIGVRWRGFLRLLSHHKERMIQWVRGDITWEQLLDMIERSLDDRILRRYLLGVS